MRDPAIAAQQGLKAPPTFCGSYGTTEVVPCYKTSAHSSFSAPSEVVSCYKAPTEYSASSKVVPVQSATEYEYFSKL